MVGVVPPMPANPRKHFVASRRRSSYPERGDLQVRTGADRYGQVGFGAGDTDPRHGGGGEGTGKKSDTVVRAAWAVKAVIFLLLSLARLFANFREREKQRGMK